VKKTIIRITVLEIETGQIALLKENFGVAGRIIFQASEDRVTETFVKWNGLKTEGVQMGMLAAADPGFVLCGGDQAATQALAAE
jgi:hypothetical protein